MANPHQSFTTTPLYHPSPSYAFNPVAYEQQYASDAHVRPPSSVWDDQDIYQQYLQPEPTPVAASTPSTIDPALVNPAKRRKGKAKRQRAEAKGKSRAEPTPSPVPRPMPPPPGQASAIPLPRKGFLAHLPVYMPPNTTTPMYLTDNGKVRYYAFAGPDGLAQVCMFGYVLQMQEVYDTLHLQQQQGGPDARAQR